MTAYTILRFYFVLQWPTAELQKHQEFNDGGWKSATAARWRKSSRHESTVRAISTKKPGEHRRVHCRDTPHQQVRGRDLFRGLYVNGVDRTISNFPSCVSIIATSFSKQRDVSIASGKKTLRRAESSHDARAREEFLSSAYQLLR